MKKKEELCSFSQQEQSIVVETDIKMVPIAEFINGVYFVYVT